MGCVCDACCVFLKIPSFFTYAIRATLVSGLWSLSRMHGKARDRDASRGRVLSGESGFM